MPTERYSYTCACGGDKMSGTLAAGQWQCEEVYKILDEAWRRTHDGQECTPPEQARVIKPWSTKKKGAA